MRESPLAQEREMRSERVDRLWEWAGRKQNMLTAVMSWLET